MFVSVLAGGSGTRLWPLSRTNHPKQFLRLTGDRSLLQETIDRVLPLVPIQQIAVVTEHTQAAEVARELPDLPPANILAEPLQRGTATALGLAALWVQRQNPREVIVSLHSDHLIGDPDAFRQTLLAAVEAASDGRHLLTLGIRPTEPATSYGYIRVGQPIAPAGSLTYYRVDEFVEKPDRPRAERYLADGSYLWNSGIFVWRVDTFLQRFAELLPDTFKRLQEIAAELDRPDGKEALARIYPTIQSQTIDVGIMERADNVAVIPAAFPWSDVGSWAELLEVLPADSEGNVVRGTHIGLDTQRSLIFALTKPVATIGLSDLVIVDTPDVLLVCPRDRAQAVKQLVERLGASEALRHLL